jgi:hypothetical protein
MATLQTGNTLTLAELARRMGPNNNIGIIAEVLNKTNEIFSDMSWVEANGLTYHKMVQRLSLPTGEWRRINGGVGVHASQTREVTVGIGMLEDYSEPDKKLIDMAPDSHNARMGEARAFIEGLGQTLGRSVIYANHATDPEQFSGLAPMLNTLSQDNVVGCGGTGSDLTSVYAVQWGEDKTFMVYPKGSKSARGVEYRDLGENTKVLADGKQYQIYRDHFQIHAGLAVKDDRCIGRVCNIETSGSSNTFDEDKLIELLNKMPQRGGGATIYCNRTVFTQLDILAKDKTNVQYGPSDTFGRPVMTFRGLPVRLVDSIVDTESAVS